MNIQDFFNQEKVIDLSFFNFENAITAAYYANDKLEVQKVNKNFVNFFPVLGNITNVYFPDVLEQLGVPEEQISQFQSELDKNGKVLIPQILINIDGEERIFSLLSAKTKSENFDYLNGVQGQFVDRTAEWELRKEREKLYEQSKIDNQIIEEKSAQLENLATRLAKYLSPQIYKSIFEEKQEVKSVHSRKNLTIFFSDIIQFTDLTDTMEPEKLAKVINSYLSEMTTIAVKSGGTIDKFIGDAIMVFFGDPETEGEVQDALKCVEMAILMRQRVEELQKHWKKMGVINGLGIRMGISTGFCTVGNFGSDLRLDYTVLGSPVNLAARLQSAAERNGILIDENTNNLINDVVQTEKNNTITPKGFVRPIDTFILKDFKSQSHKDQRKMLSHSGERIEINVIDSSDIRAAIEELKNIQEKFEKEYSGDEK
jgi:class 3 adenylate cyclase